jgi:hypothetical protein
MESADENGIHGTLLMVRAGKGDEAAKAFITLQRCAGSE